MAAGTPNGHAPAAAPASDPAKVTLNVEVCLRPDCQADLAAVRSAALAFLGSLPSVRYAEGPLALPPGQQPLLEAAAQSVRVVDLPAGRVAPNKLLLQASCWSTGVPAWQQCPRAAPLPLHCLSGSAWLAVWCRLRRRRAAPHCCNLPPAQWDVNWNVSGLGSPAWRRRQTGDLHQPFSCAALVLLPCLLCRSALANPLTKEPTWSR